MYGCFRVRWVGLEGGVGEDVYGENSGTLQIVIE